jgi:hypothetical protein
MFEITEETSILFANNPASPLKIFFAAGGLYHLQATNQKNVLVKFPVNGKFQTSAEILKITSGIERPSKAPENVRDRNFDLALFHVVYNPSLLYTPARVFYNAGRCEIGPNFETLPYQFKQFILEHEKGHFYYSKENDADTYALNRFMARGFNASQAFFALEMVLKQTPENILRFKKIFNNISNFY